MGKENLINLREKSPTTQYTPRQALERALDLLTDESEQEGKMLILIDDPAYLNYQWIQGGGMTYAEMNWMADQFKHMILLQEDDE